MTDESLEIRPGPEGCLLLKIRVRPGASRAALEGLHGGALKLSVPAPPEKGKANKALLELLSRALGLPKRDLSLAKGSTSRDKWVALRGMGREELRRRVREALKR